jgi:transcriptional regulator with XRE-family HTH domain
MTARLPSGGGQLDAAVEAAGNSVEQQRGGVRVGEALARARGRAGLTVAEVSQRTRISEAIITGIESDDYSACGGDFYARGNIRGIAQAVGTDPEPLISEYDELHRAPGVLSAVSLDELLAPAQAPGRHRRNWAGMLGLALLVALGFAGYTFLTGSSHATRTPPAAADHAGRTRIPPGPRPTRMAPSPHPATPARRPVRPAATVRAYITAINSHRFARAWRLGGRNAGGSYAGFVSGFNGTARDTLAIVSVSGDVVTARLSARQTDGAVNTYQGTYTVHHGVIVGFDVVQVG